MRKKQKSKEGIGILRYVLINVPEYLFPNQQDRWQ